jgi:serine/threonine protein kinase
MLITALWFYRRRVRAIKKSSRLKLRGQDSAFESEGTGLMERGSKLSERPEPSAQSLLQTRPQQSSFSANNLLDMPWSDWKIDPSELSIVARPDGSEWLLGSGASGRVFKALRNGVQIVAVKVFKEEATRGAITSLNSPYHAAQFRQEISILKSCHDKNIVQFIGACLTVGQTILVTEFLENGDLYKAINSQQGNRYHWYRMQLPDGKPLPNSGMARRVALDVARGLHFLHTKKIVHFDLKSANILLARDFTAKLADVGLARVLHDDVMSTRREVGTFAWAAPEVLLGQRITEAADIYSFGVLLHELSAVESPRQRHLRKLAVPEEVPAEIGDLIERCLDANPLNRPTARELVAVLSLLPATPPFPPVVPPCSLEQ